MIELILLKIEQVVDDLVSDDDLPKYNYDDDYQNYQKNGKYGEDFEMDSFGGVSICEAEKDLIENVFDPINHPESKQEKTQVFILFY